MQEATNWDGLYLLMRDTSAATLNATMQAAASDQSAMAISLGMVPTSCAGS